ncbi:PAS domain-containing protein [Aliiroseovarius crassostreae]|uniref:methyl-accepting chemotaxis protein n=1 Tax=Aliiroseovarius crassostreae TaxID=154981 RepID=UPI0021AE7856|nr:methyl-accepting chemotaxis protein [Aliiroseovarius crassostreae]UWQ00452.1 PAS domain-containing protein [Aliiroseovarius crassostreae]
MTTDAHGKFSPKKLNSVFVKLTATIVASIGVAALSMVFLSLKGSDEVVDKLTSAKNQEITRLLGQSLLGSFQVMSANGIQNRLMTVVDPEDPYSPTVIAVAKNGRVLAQMGPELNDMPLLEGLVEEAVQTQRAQEASDGLYYAYPIYSADGKKFYGVLAFAWNAKKTRELVRVEQVRTTAISAAVFLVALVLIMFGVQKVVVGPLKQIGTAVRQISKGHYDVEIKAAAHGDEMGNLAGALCDFAGELATGAELEKQNQFRSTAFRDVSTNLMMTDDTLTIQEVNPAMKALFAEKKEEFLSCIKGFPMGGAEGESLETFLQAATDPTALDRIAAAENLPCMVDLVVGESRYRVMINDVRDAEEDVIGYVAEWSDISDSFVNQALMKAIDENQIKVDLNLDGEIMSGNAHFSDLLGREIESLSGLAFEELYSGSDGNSEQFQQVIQHVSQGASLYDHFVLTGSDGSPLVVDGGFVPVRDLDGRLMRIVLIATDVTETRREIEASEVRRAEMEAAQNRVVDALREGLSRLSDGDLTTEISDAFSENYEQLRHDFNRAVDNLLTAMRGVVENAEMIQGEASEISNAADDLSQRTERQAATLEETAAALDELTSSVRSAADGAAHANEVVESARKNAEVSGEVVREAVEAMGEIETSSLQISKITGVIDDIAFQTNLLALNAGVEAARAGEAGRGFAVVASEVRALAQRSSDAAREINELISASGSQVKRGVHLVDQAGEALVGIVESVSEISRNVGEIAISAREQSAGLAEINEAVNQLDQVTQQNAAMFEQTTAASHSLTCEAKTLTSTMSRFKTGQAERPAAQIIEADVFVEPISQTEESAIHPHPLPGPQGSVAIAQQVEADHTYEDWDEF